MLDPILNSATTSSLLHGPWSAAPSIGRSARAPTSKFTVCFPSSSSTSLWCSSTDGWCKKWSCWWGGGGGGGGGLGLGFGKGSKPWKVKAERGGRWSGDDEALEAMNWWNCSGTPSNMFVLCFFAISPLPLIPSPPPCLSLLFLVAVNGQIATCKTTRSSLPLSLSSLSLYLPLRSYHLYQSIFQSIYTILYLKLYLKKCHLIKSKIFLIKIILFIIF